MSFGYSHPFLKILRLPPLVTSFDLALMSCHPFFQLLSLFGICRWCVVPDSPRCQLFVPPLECFFRLSPSFRSVLWSCLSGYCSWVPLAGFDMLLNFFFNFSFSSFSLRDKVLVLFFSSPFFFSFFTEIQIVGMLVEILFFFALTYNEVFLRC